MEGKISEHPLAELVREITAASLNGVLRLSRDPARIAIYFEEGKLVFATSNLRAHRLREVVKRNGLTEAHVAEFQISASDDELAAAMLQKRLLNSETLAAIRVNQVGDVLRLALLWIDGAWEFDPRVRLADEVRVQINVNRLLLECARHLPAEFVTSRVMSGDGTYLKTNNESNTTPLLDVEAKVLSHASDSQTASHLAALSGSASEADAYRAIYALSLSGLLQPSSWPSALAADTARVSTKAAAVTQTRTSKSAKVEPDEFADVQALFARLENAKDHYDVLDVGRLATLDEIKSAYHALARRFHPDRFHQSEAELRTRIESAFARIARAYETLSDQSGRAAYDAKHSSKAAATAPKPATPATAPNGTKPAVPENATRAETSFQHGLDSFKRNRQDEATRFLAEAAMLSPREARYRAHYGQALARQPNLRRIAETELQAALSLEPQNAAYRVMLAELYKQLGLHRRAEGELERALVIEPNHEAARSLLRSLKSKKP